jgi:ATP-dependent RNA helicase DeaD
VDEDEIASLMPSIFRKLEWLDKEDIIKRMVSLEFNRMIDYYKDADEIEVVDERQGRNREAAFGKKDGRRSRTTEEGFVRYFINFGKTDGLFPNQLIDLVNKCVPGKVRIGKIDLLENFSFFEVEEAAAKRVMERMNGFEIDGRRISVEPAQGKKGEGKGEHRGESRGERKGAKKKAAPFYDRFDKRARNNDKPWRRSRSTSGRK